MYESENIVNIAGVSFTLVLIVNTLLIATVATAYTRGCLDGDAARDNILFSALMITLSAIGDRALRKGRAGAAAAALAAIWVAGLLQLMLILDAQDAIAAGCPHP